MTVLNKFIASSGFCSRRKAVEYIKAKEVFVNNEVIIEPFHKVSFRDLVQIKGKVIKPQKFQYFLLNKPKNVICTLHDPAKRKTIADLFSRIDERVYPVGRLDRNTTGLIVVTNDGDFNQQLAHPKYEVKKIYNVTLDKAIAPYHFSILLKGLNLFDGFMKVDGIYYSSDKHKRGVSVIIHSGRNHIVKRLFQEIGFKVMKLDRPYYGGLTKKHLPIGTFRKLKDSEIEFLKSDQRKQNKEEAAQYEALAAKAPKRAPYPVSKRRRKPAGAAPDNRKSLTAAYKKRNSSAPQKRSKVAESFRQKRKRTFKRSKS